MNPDDLIVLGWAINADDDRADNKAWTEFVEAVEALAQKHNTAAAPDGIFIMVDGTKFYDRA